MNTTNKLDQLKQQYFDLSREFLLALKNNECSDELELIRKQIREITAEIENIEPSNAKAED
jgi:hypothetical protein